MLPEWWLSNSGQVAQREPEYSARKRANKKYNDRFVEIKVRVTPEKRSIIKDHADAMGESATAFINRAIDEAMERDLKK